MIGKTTILTSLAFAAVSCIATPVQADIGSQGRLSQIDFDENYIATQPAEAEPQAAPSKTKSKTTRKSNVTPPKSNAVSPKKGNPSRAMLSETPTERILTEKLITPRLRGPFTDEGAPHRIRSTSKWKPQKRGICAQAADDTQMCSKAKALREVLYRFSGNNDFFESQCSQSCGDADAIAVPQGLNLEDTNGGSFKFITDAGSCQYQLERNKAGKWLVIKPSRVSCVCVPKSCLLG